MRTTYTDQLLQHIYERGYLNEAQAAELMDEHERTARGMRQIVLDQGIVSPDQMQEEIAELLGTEVIDLNSLPIPESTYRSVPSSSARMYNIVPVEQDTTHVVLATYDLPSPNMIDDLMFILGRDVQFVVAEEQSVTEHILKHYGDDSLDMDNLWSELGQELEDAGTKAANQLDLDDAAELEKEANKAPVIRFVNLVLYQAVQARASDIHFEPFEHDFKIRYRVDGALYEMTPPPKHLALPIISRIKVVSGLNISERRLPQDGRIQLNMAGRQVDFRVSCLPTQFGESVVLRVLDQTGVGLELETLGMPDDVYQWFCDDILKPNGIVLVTGPTGSGKTTTLYAALRKRNEIGVKLLTAEDPVEYDVEGIVQCQTDARVGNTFAKLLRAFLRQDPDIILVGEIRDLETAQIAIQASLTGHLVFSTLHTNDAAGTVTRLVDMGVEPFLIASTLEAVMATRLVRTICKDCRTPYQPDDLILKQLNLSRQDVQDRPFYYGKGCMTCNQTGYKGRRGVYEYLQITEPIRRLVTERKPTLVLRDRARELGMRTLREDGVRCVLDGLTTVEEVIKYT